MVMSALGFTINTLTLLGLVLAIGLVVDDAIVVLENIYRRIEAGRPPLLAALEGSKEIGFAVVATTLVLVAVFVPLSFIQGDIGRLFGEFGITLAAAVMFSSFVALTLSPMMSSKLLRAHADATVSRRGLASRVDAAFERLTARYRSLLERVLAHPWRVLWAALALSALAVVLLAVLPSEYAPREDRGVFAMLMQAPEGASFEYTDRHARRVEDILAGEVDDGPLKRFLLRLPADFGDIGAVDSARFIVLLDPWDEREESDAEISARLRPRLAEIPGVRVAIFPSQSLGIRSDGRPVKLVIGGPDYAQLETWRDLLLEAVEDMPELINADSNYQERKPGMTVRVDRDRAATLGISLSDVGRTLETMLGSRIASSYEDRGREYDVILQGRSADRSSPDDLTHLYVRGRGGGLVPLANLVRLSEEARPQRLDRFDRMRAITIEAGLAEGTRLGEAVDALEETARRVLPPSARQSWDGEAREFRESGGGLNATFALALLIVFLVLAAQFESFRHPLIIMVTVPLALTGALLGLWLAGGTINVFSQIGAVLLIGLAAKNGVLIVEFANQLRDRGEPFEKALVDACCIRLRPILMTSASTTFGAVPLLFGGGAGAETRQPIGIVVVSGVVLSALLTLVVVPALYMVMARGTRSPEYVSRMIEQLARRESTPDAIGSEHRVV